MNIEDSIRQKITERFAPEHFELINDSDKHIGHAGHDGIGQSHFTLVVVSSQFEGYNRIQRHRLVYDAVGELFIEGLHALSINAILPSEHKSK